MARDFNGTSDYASATIDLSAFDKITVSFWLWIDALSSDRLVMELTSLITNAGSFHANTNDGGGGSSNFTIGSNAPAYSQGVFTAPSTGTWHHWCATLDRSAASSEVANVYIDGSAQSLSRPFDGNHSDNFANSTLYIGSRNGASLFLDGKLAELSIYAGVLLDSSEIGALAKGFSAQLVRSASLQHYWPMIGKHSPEIDICGGASATLSGTSASSHPRVIYPRRRAAFSVAAAAGSYSSSFFRENAGLGAAGAGPFARANAGLGAIA